MPRMTTTEIETFLDEPGHLLRIATVDAEGHPSVTPVWFVHEDGRIFVTPRERSSWWADLQRHPRTCIVVDEEALPYRKVIVRADVQVVHPIGEDDAWRDRYRRIAERYVGPDGAEAYLRATWDEPRALLAVPVAGATTWRMPVAGEAPEGIWASRYYHPPAPGTG
jgi:nitroimidazol reductase NimA-like FMN-containing flavoprotein (pyridoxamine 5'-phosphate oxidase superfamily)